MMVSFPLSVLLHEQAHQGLKEGRVSVGALDPT